MASADEFFFCEINYNLNTSGKEGISLTYHGYFLNLFTVRLNH